MRLAAGADRGTRIEYRDALVAFGLDAVRHCAAWLDDDELRVFAILVMERAAADPRALPAAIETFQAGRRACPPSDRPYLEGALRRLGVVPRASATARSNRPELAREAVPLPRSVRALVRNWEADGKLPQPKRKWYQDEWVGEFPEFRRILQALPPLFDRSDIRPVGLRAGRESTAAVEALVATMAWGAIDFNYRFKWTRDMLATRNVEGRLLRAVTTLSSAGAVAAYRRLQHTGDCHVHRLGESFLTEFLYFCQPDGYKMRALILDSYVSVWLEKNARIRFTSGRGSDTGYEHYLESLHSWEGNLRCRAEDVEFCIFRAEAIRRESGWGD
jgi:hypothetical protein